VESSQGPNYSLEKSEELNGAREDNNKGGMLNFKRYEMMTRATKPNIDLGFNSKPKAKEKQNILEEVNAEETVEVESEDIIFDAPTDKGIWTMSGYQGAKKPETKNPNVKGIVISHEEKRKEKTLFSGFEVKKKKTPQPDKPEPIIVNSAQTKKILHSGGFGSEDIASLSKTNTTPKPQFKKTPIIDEEQKKKKEKEKRERALASDLFSGMTNRNKQKSSGPVQKKGRNTSGPLYQVKPKHMSLEDYEEVWEDLDYKIEGTKECSSLVTLKWLRGILISGLKFAIVSEEGEDLIAAGEERGLLICLYVTFDADDNTVEYTVASKNENVAKKVQNRIEVLLM
jgi:hypothetical protein